MSGQLVKIYADGGCRGNGNECNIGGWGAVMLDMATKKFRELKGAEPSSTTNNKMELTSAIEALKAMKKHDIPIEVHMDSQYVVSGMTSWLASWKKNNWRTSAKKPIKNKELWKELDGLASKFADLKWVKVKGHSDDKWNNRADELANEAMDEIA
ncbi:MAG: ribonuclease HI [Candidatus Bathyarchaeota archaeon]|nr:ribonuclease HI [Candidatus Bathyarchaeota archaeon]